MCTSHIEQLEKKVQLLQNTVVERTFGINKIQDNDRATKFYTGLPSYAVFLLLYKWVPKSLCLSFYFIFLVYYFWITYVCYLSIVIIVASSFFNKW